LAGTVILTEPESPRKARAGQLREMVTALSPAADIRVEPDWREALALAQRLAANDDLIVVTGSLYLVGDVRKWWKNR
jgi:dihydrofolate synthase/folylpolyglutamate synthase